MFKLTLSIAFLMSSLYSLAQSDNSNPNDTRYFIGPSGIPLEKGSGYYQNVWVFYNSIHYGIGKNISIGGGGSLLAYEGVGWGGYVTIKAGFDVAENVHFGGGLMTGQLWFQETINTLGYGVFTFGSFKSNLSVGVGFPLNKNIVSDYPAFTFSGIVRISEWVAFLSENYILPMKPGDNKEAPTLFGIHGFRYHVKNHSWDIGFIYIPKLGESIGGPYIGYSRIF